MSVSRKKTNHLTNMEAVAVCEIVKVRVIGIDKARGRVSLSMRDLLTTGVTLIG